jgi:diamine N-acetyltransferase
MDRPEQPTPAPEASEAPSAPDHLTVAGQRVALGPLRRELLPLCQRWFGDFAVGATYFTGSLVPETREGAEERYERYTRAPGAARAVGFTVYERATGRPIGTASLQNVDHFNRTAELGLVIGETACWGRGYGTETARLLLEYGFVGLGLHSVRLTVFSYNTRAIRAYTRAGFREVGRWREAKRLAGRAFDIVCMDCLATEFPREGGVLGRFLPQD